MDNLYTPRLELRLRAVESKLVHQIKIWPLNLSSLVMVMILSTERAIH